MSSVPSPAPGALPRLSLASHCAGLCYCHCCGFIWATALLYWTVPSKLSPSSGSERLIFLEDPWVSWKGCDMYPVWSWALHSLTLCTLASWGSLLRAALFCGYGSKSLATVLMLFHLTENNTRFSRRPSGLSPQFLGLELMILFWFFYNIWWPFKISSNFNFAHKYLSRLAFQLFGRLQS